LQSGASLNRATKTTGTGQRHEISPNSVQPPIPMTRGPPGNFWDRFHYRWIQTKIGEALRTLLVPTEPPSDQIVKALQELDHQREGHEAAEKQSGSETKRDK
jgi:hypothetical protein